VTKGWYLIVSVVALVVATVARGFTGFVVAAVVVGVPYYVSLRLHPRTRHIGLFGLWGCGGTGEERGSLLRWGHRRCPGCDSGRIIRTGAGYLGSQQIQDQYRRRKAARKKAKTEHRWR
jgi:hypothetical protein